MRYIRWLVILIAIFGGSAWLVLSAPSFKDCVKNGSQAENTQKAEEKSAFLAIVPGDYVGCAWKFADDKGAALTAIFTVILGLGTIAIVFLTGDIVVAGERSSQRQLRAYVGIEQVELVAPRLGSINYHPYVPAPGTSSPDRLTFHIRNFGLTPANRVHLWANWIATDFGTRLPRDFEYRDIVDEVDESGEGLRPTWNRPTIFPTQMREQVIPVNDLSLFNAAHAGQVALYVYGHVDYRDVFNRQRTTTFCFACDPGGPAGKRFSAYEDHNEAK